MVDFRTPIRAFGRGVDECFRSNIRAAIDLVDARSHRIGMPGGEPRRDIPAAADNGRMKKMNEEELPMDWLDRD